MGYTVFWWKVNDSSFNITSTEEPRVWLSGLEAYTEYCVTVSAMNNVGSGPNSSLFTARTEEEGKKKVYLHSAILYSVITLAFFGLSRAPPALTSLMKEGGLCDEFQY